VSGDIPRAKDGSVVTPQMLAAVKADVMQGRGKRRDIAARYGITLDMLTQIQYGKLDWTRSREPRDD